MTAPIAPFINSGSAVDAALKIAACIFDHARGLGFEQLRLSIGKLSSSRSRYINFRDAHGRDWKIRVSAHRRPARSDIPHLDVDSARADAEDKAIAFLDEVARGEVVWFEACRSGHAASHRLQSRIRRRCS